MNDELHAVICHVYDEVTLLDRLEIDMETLVTILTPQIEERIGDIQDDLSEAGAYDDL